MIDLPKGEFGVVLMDCPWQTITYDKKRSLPQRAKGDQHYETMSFDQLSALPVADLGAKDFVLLMWIIDSHLDQALKLAEIYGCTFRTIAFIWDKGRMSFGKWTRKEGEICLLFARGKPPRLSGGVRQIIREPARQHSRKPDCQYERIEALVGGPYLELFGRKLRPGWMTWGDQAGILDGRHIVKPLDLGPFILPSDLKS